ncbi:septal ring lytic transglycosylase RlpA family protein [Thiohalocapsa marina]|uniref:septal ring lytic transglycosylase RlpA family protein n=1 Tax=Thiohalocapsa marina TaxID=424902 RepID=UPI001FEC526F
MNRTTSGRRASLSAAMGLTLLASATLLLSGCGSSPSKSEAGTATGGSDIPDAVPRVEPKSKYGNMKSYVVFGKTYHTKASSRNHVERGVASWYGTKFHGRKTSSGEPYDMHRMTAAHKTLPLPSYVRVTNLENGRSAVVRVNDRGPFVDDRIIDLSYAAARKLGVDKQGIARVEVTSIDPRDHGGKPPKTLTASTGTQPRPAIASTRPTPPASPVAGPITSPAGSPASRSTEAASSLTPAVVSTADSAGSATGPSMADRGLYLQVGAFGARNNAEQLRRRLTSLLPDPVQLREDRPQPTGSATALYKVRVGPVPTHTDALALSRKLSALGLGEPMLVQE